MFGPNFWGGVAFGVPLGLGLGILYLIGVAFNEAKAVKLRRQPEPEEAPSEES